MSGPDGQIPRQEIALDALKDVRKLLDDWQGSDWALTRPAQEIDHILHLAYARLRMDDQSRDRRPPRWLAKVIGFTYPREVDRRGRKTTVLCFPVKVTDATKAVAGKTIEVQLAMADAARLAGQMGDFATRYPQEEEPGDLGELLPKRQEGDRHDG